jgi:F420-dependent oxidoreductase-like protein
MTGRVRLSAMITLAADLQSTLALAIDLSRAGVDVIGVAEAYGVDSVSLLGYLAGRTEGVQLMSQILPLYSRTPTLTAMTAAGLDLVSEGRFILGLGASGPQVVEGWHGVPYTAPVGRTREVVEICRKVWRREYLAYDGRHYQLPLPEGQGTGLGKPLKLITHPVRDRIPIYLAALGDKNVELAAEVADGWIPTLFLPERAQAVWGESLARGGKNRAPELGPLEVVAGAPLAFGTGLDDLRNQARRRLALYVGGMGARGKNFYNDLVSRYGFELEATRVQDLYLGGDKRAASAALPQALVDGTSLVGDEAFVRERVQAFLSAGVTTLQVDPVGADPLGDVRRLREMVDSL